MTKDQQYDRLFETLDALCADETDAVSLMATVACELSHAFEQFSWVGFYRNVGGEVLKVGPYQGAHGYLTIPFAKGVCGKCARERAVQNVPDVSRIPHHIACSSTTKSELVIPILNAAGELLAVLDIDSDRPAAFDETDEKRLPEISKLFRGNSPAPSL